MSQKLQILLATYNSGAYLAPQLDSIFAQDFPDFEVLIRDGGSTDGTMAVISRYQEKFPGRIVFVGRARSGACENFAELLKHADGELIMFSDHDDIWMPDKISATVAEYRALEKIIVQDDAAWIPLFSRLHYYVLSERAEGFRVSWNGSVKNNFRYFSVK